MKFLRRRARLVLVGLFGGELKLGGHFKLDQATEALTMLTKGKIIGRGVINP
jgi:alcohol dehydrogenase, propanol-preferring